MNRYLMILAVFALMAAAGTASAQGGPYAGVVRVADTTVAVGAGTTITYQLAFAADSVTIDLLDSSNVVAATFSGTTTSGLNTVVWDGTANNAGGTPVPVGTYRPRITVANSAAAGWTEVVTRFSQFSNPANPLYDLFSPVGTLVYSSQDSDLYGYLLIRSSSGSSVAVGPHAAIIVLNPNLLPRSGDGFADREVVSANPANGTYWGAAFVPGTNNILFAGQPLSTPPTPRNDYLLAVNTANTLAATTTVHFITGQQNDPRHLAIKRVGTQNWGFVAASNNMVRKFPLDDTGAPTGAGFNVLSIAGTQYSRSVFFDPNGNMYWILRAGGATGASTIYRWDAALVDAILSDSDPKLTESNASWTITMDTTLAQRVGQGLVFRGDDVLFAATSSTGGSVSHAIYNVGTWTTPTLTKMLVAADIIHTDNATNRRLHGTFGNMDLDPVGNLVLTNRTSESITLLTPGGNTSNVTLAPLSQIINIEPVPAVDGVQISAEPYLNADNSAPGIDTNTRFGFGDSAKVERVVAYDTDNYIQIFVEGSQHSGNRMYLLIDSDANASTGWRGGTITGATYDEAGGLARFAADSVFNGGWDLVVSVGSSGENPPNTLFHTVLAMNADGSINTETYLGSTGTAGGTLSGTVRGNTADLLVGYTPGDGVNQGHEYRVPRSWMLNLLAATQYRVALLTGNGANNFFSNSTIPENANPNNLGAGPNITDLTGLVAPVWTYQSTAPTSVESWMLFE